MPIAKGAALITGGARRIGAALALALATKGFDIALHYRASHDAAAAVAHEIEAMGRRCRLLQGDLASEADLTGLVERADRELPELDVLVNNASLFEPARLLETGTDCFDRHFNVNLRAPFVLVRDFSRNGRAGQVINMLDTRVAKAEGSHMAYTLSKKALFEFTRMAARELGPAVRVNAVSPGLILPPPGQDEHYLREKSSSIPLKRPGDTKNLISAVLFLIENPFVTGECIFVDGGEHL